jgi:serine/threonine-protein kinase MRCK
MARVGEGKKIFQLEYIAEEQLLVALAGKQRTVRLIPVRALDGSDVEWIKVAETKGCVTFATGPMRRAIQGQQITFCLCVAIKKQVHYMIFNST